MGDIVWDRANRTLFKIPDLKNYQPWHNAARGKRTRTADMSVALDVKDTLGPLIENSLCTHCKKEIL